MTKNNKLYTLVFVLLWVFFCNSGSVYSQITAKDVENPKTKGLTNWVCNQDNILSPATVQTLNDAINRLYDSTSCQISVVVINGDKQTSARELSMELFDLWHPGMKDKDNGLIILVITQARQCFFRTGYGIEDVITDAKSTRIFNQIMKPCFINGDWDGGVLAGTQETVNQIYKYYDNPSNPHNNKEDFRNLLKSLLIGYFLLGIGVFLLAKYQLDNSIKNIAHTYRSKRVNNYRKVFRQYAGIVAILSIFTLPVYIIMYKRKLNSIRKEKVFCSCGHEMKLLSEKEEDEFLNHTQQLEETLNSRDYDVWLCPQCGRTVIYCYEENSPYEICPVCHAKAYKKVSEQMMHTGIFRQKDILRTTYHCKNCNHTDYKDEEIDSSSSFFAGAMAGSMAGSMHRGSSWGSSGGFGGFSGGSFGGGFSGGGGGGGSW
ncbi:MAG: TPM domain-containing protein [Bacteroidales bacterium]|nr:TPM domain-containing protein [Bacteroidales bacterium]